MYSYIKTIHLSTTLKRRKIQQLNNQLYASFEHLKLLDFNYLKLLLSFFITFLNYYILWLVLNLEYRFYNYFLNLFNHVHIVVKTKTVCTYTVFRYSLE